MNDIVRIEGESKLLKDRRNNAVLSSQKAYEEWVQRKKARDALTLVEKLETRVADLERKLEEAVKAWQTQ